MNYCSYPDIPFAKFTVTNLRENGVLEVTGCDENARDLKRENFKATCLAGSKWEPDWRSEQKNRCCFPHAGIGRSSTSSSNLHCSEQASELFVPCALEVVYAHSILVSHYTSTRRHLSAGHASWRLRLANFGGHHCGVHRLDAVAHRHSRPAFFCTERKPAYQSIAFSVLLHIRNSTVLVSWVTSYHTIFARRVKAFVSNRSSLFCLRNCSANGAANRGVIARTLYYRRDPNQSGSLLNPVSIYAPAPEHLKRRG